MKKTELLKNGILKAAVFLSALLIQLSLSCKKDSDSSASTSPELGKDSLKIGLYKTSYDNYEVNEEFKVVNGEEYVNRIWYVDKKGDTLYDKGNFYTVQLPDTATVNEIISIKIFLERPYFGYTSRLILFPTDKSSTKNNSLAKDTIFSIAESGDKKLQKQLEGAPTNLMLIHNVKFLSPGEKTINAILKEIDTARVESELVEKERIMYLKEQIFIKDKKG